MKAVLKAKGGFDWCSVPNKVAGEGMYMEGPAYVGSGCAAACSGAALPEEYALAWPKTCLEGRGIVIKP